MPDHQIRHQSLQARLIFFNSVQLSTKITEITQYSCILPIRTQSYNKEITVVPILIHYLSFLAQVGRVQRVAYSNTCFLSFKSTSHEGHSTCFPSSRLLVLFSPDLQIPSQDSKFDLEIVNSIST